MLLGGEVRIVRDGVEFVCQLQALRAVHPPERPEFVRQLPIPAG